MAKYYIAKSATHGSASIASIVQFGFSQGTKTYRDNGPKGVEEMGISGYMINVEVYAKSLTELNGLVGATAANLTLVGVGDGGANKTITLKNVYFDKPPQVAVAPIDSQESTPAVMVLRGECLVASADSLATLVVES